MLIGDERLAQLSEELTSYEDVAAAEKAVHERLGVLRNRYLENFRTAVGEIGVLKNRIPHIVDELKLIKGVLTDFIKVSEEVYEAQTFKTQLDRIEADINRLKVVESCLLVAQDFDANLQALEALAKRMKAINAGTNRDDLTAELAEALKNETALLEWWSFCENDQKIIEAFGQWRFSKFAKIESDIRRVIQEHIRGQLTKILELAQSSINEKFLNLAQSHTVLCEDYASAVTACLLEWHQKEQIVDITNIGKTLFKIMTRPSAVHLVNLLINNELRMRKNNLDSIREIISQFTVASDDDDLTGSAGQPSRFSGEFADIEWVSGIRPVSITVNQRYVEDLYKYHINHIMLTLPITVRSTMQALNVGSDIRSVLSDIRRKFIDTLPAVYSQLRQLFEILDPPRVQVPLLVIREDVVQAIIQNVYHPLTTAFPSARATVSPFLATVHFIGDQVLLPVINFIHTFYPGEPTPEVTDILAPLTSLILTSTAEEINKAYVNLVGDYITRLNCSTKEGSMMEIQKISSFTMDLLRQLFEDPSEQAQEIDGILIPQMLASLLELFLKEVGQSNPAESASKCYITGLDVVALLKLVDSLIVPEDSRAEGENNKAAVRLARAHRELRTIATACAEALKSDPRGELIYEGLSHISDR